MMRGFLAPVGEPTVKEYKIICPKASSGTVIKKPVDQNKKKKTNY